jgi:hypothetical protein
MSAWYNACTIFKMHILVIESSRSMKEMHGTIAYG